MGAFGCGKRCNELAKSFDQEAVYDTNVGVVCSHGAVMVQFTLVL